MNDLVTVLAFPQCFFFVFFFCEQGANQTKYGNSLMFVKFSGLTLLSIAMRNLIW